MTDKVMPMNGKTEANMTDIEFINWRIKGIKDADEATIALIKACKQRGIASGTYALRGEYALEDEKDIVLTAVLTEDAEREIQGEEKVSEMLSVMTKTVVASSMHACDDCDEKVEMVSEILDELMDHGDHGDGGIGPAHVLLAMHNLISKYRSRIKREDLKKSTMNKVKRAKETLQ